MPTKNSIIQSEPSEYYLQAAFYFSDETIRAWQEETMKRMQDRQKDSAYETFVNWKKQENEIAVFTLYGNTNFSIPIQFDCIFDYSNPEIYYKGKFAVTQAIFEGWMPSDSIAKGHKHLCILTFEDKVPDILKQLYYETKKYSEWKGNTLLMGLCNFTDLKTITERIKLVK